MDGVDRETWHMQAQNLRQALFQTPSFRNESDGQPLVYGYVRSAHRRPAYVAACKRALVRYCQRERLQLCTTFADQEVPNDAMARSGLSGLCDVLRLPDSFAAVLVSPSHLSPDANTAVMLTKRLRATGARILVVRPTPKQHVRDGGPPGADTDLSEWWQ